MPPKKSSSKSAKKKTTSVKKKAKSTTDIKPKKKSTSKAVPTNTFTIKQLDGVPEVEPLVDDVDVLEQEIQDMEDVMTENLDISYEPVRKPAMNVSAVADVDDDQDEPVSERSMKENLAAKLEDIAPRDLIKVRFGTFVNLVANHDMDEVVAENAEKELIMEANLLTELASSRDQREERKVPLVFLVGIAIGVVLTYIFFST